MHSQHQPIANGGGRGSVEFFAGLYVPTVLERDGEPARALDYGQTYGIASGDPYLVMIPDEVHQFGTTLFFQDSPWWAGGAQGNDFALRIPAVLYWDSNISATEFGTVTFSTGTDAAWDIEGPEEQAYHLDGPRGTKSLYLVVKYEELKEYPQRNLFRESGLSFEVSPGDDSLLQDYAPGRALTATGVEYAVPNESVRALNQLLNTTSTIYKNGRRAAGALSDARGAGVIERVARELAYWEARGAGIDNAELLEHTRIDGIGGFKSVVDEAPGLQEIFGADLNIGFFGPTVGFKIERNS